MSRRVSATVGLAVLLVVAVSGPTRAQEGGSEPTGFNLLADSSGVSNLFGAPGQAPYPVAAGTVPQSMSTLSAGPSGHALASVAWPGPLAGNAGSLAGLVLPLCVPDGAGVCSPKPGDLPPGALAAANYPVRAEADSNGPNEVTQPGMRAKALGNEARADAEVQDASSPNAFAFGSAVTRTRNAIESGKAVSTARSHVTGISVAGVVTIDSVTTEASASSDGEKPESGGRTVVEGLEIGGQPATVDESGVHVGEEGSENPLSDPVAELNAGMKESGIEMFLTRPAQRNEGDTASYSSGSLVIVWTIPQSGGYVLTMSIGGSNATAQAAPGFLDALDDAVPAVDIPSGVASDGAPLAVVPAEGTAVTPAALNPVAGPSGQPLVPLDAVPAAFFDGVSAAAVLLALVGAGVLFAGLRRLGGAALDRAPSACPLEGRPR
jgi:hypothetical protein